ncbi:MAG: DUF4845 domain-containing protein [Cellvibrionaceae bacterium]|nr:DUF4845 domain-containing protein [Cellvibrionaceae bacterium]
MSGFNRHRGLSALGWLFVLSVAGFGLLTASKLGPHYLDNRFVVASLKDLSEDPAFPGMTLKAIREKLNKTFRVNNVRGKPLQSINIKRNAKGTVVTIAYEEVIPFIYNIDVVLRFNSVLDSAKPDACCNPGV